MYFYIYHSFYNRKESMWIQCIYKINTYTQIHTIGCVYKNKAAFWED